MYCPNTSFWFVILRWTVYTERWIFTFSWDTLGCRFGLLTLWILFPGQTKAELQASFSRLIILNLILNSANFLKLVLAVSFPLTTVIYKFQRNGRRHYFLPNHRCVLSLKQHPHKGDFFLNLRQNYFQRRQHVIFEGMTLPVTGLLG